MKKKWASHLLFGEYPPDDHILRDLHILLKPQGNQEATIRAPVIQEMCTDQGTLSVGVMAALIDFLGGWLAINTIYPDWIATASMCLHTTARIGSGTIVGVGSVIRAGHTNVVIEVGLGEETVASSQPTASLGSAIMTFSRLPRKHDTPEMENGAEKSMQPVSFTPRESGLSQPFIEKAGIRFPDEGAGVVEVSMSPYLRNSFGSLHGGITAILTDLAGQGAARKATGKKMITSDLDIHYLSQGKTGPFQTRTNVLRQTDSNVLTRVELIDQGADHRLLAVVMNTATLA